MSPSILDLWRAALIPTATVAGPFVLAALVVGLVTSVFQAATQLQESMLAFVPKVVVIGVILALAGHQVLGRLLAFLTETADLMIRVGAGR